MHQMKLPGKVQHIHKNKIVEFEYEFSLQPGFSSFLMIIKCNHSHICRMT